MHGSAALGQRLGIACDAVVLPSPGRSGLHCRGTNSDAFSVDFEGGLSLVLLRMALSDGESTRDS